MFNGQGGTILVPIVMFGWIPAVLCLFAFLPPRRAVLAAFVVGFLFLPVTEYKLPQIPAYNKSTATCMLVLGCTLLFDPRRILDFRPKWLDIPVALYCLCPIASSLTNGLGIYDGISEANVLIFTWGFPYFIGRIYFNDVPGLRELVIAVFIGGLIYVPLCLWEIRMSPQLHRQVYGFVASYFTGWVRMGGYRPLVFMSTGLMVGMWMTAASLCGFWILLSGALPSLSIATLVTLETALVGTSILCKSSGATLLLFAGIASMTAMKYLRTRTPILALAAISVLFVFFRGSGLWDGRQLGDFATNHFAEDRASSLNTRILYDTNLAARARERLLFGWGGWGRSRIYNENGEDITLADSLWAIRFGTNGVTGLAAFWAGMLLPAVLILRRVAPRYWSNPVASCALAPAVILCLWMIDNTQNNMFNPVFLLMTGGLAGLARFVLPETPLTPVWNYNVVARAQPPPYRELVVQRRQAIKQTPDSNSGISG